MRGKIIDKIAAQFSKAASTYDAASVVEQEVGRRLIERLKDLPITPRNILDLGCGTGYFTPHLQELFPDAKIINLDFALEMVKIAKHKTSSICACATRLPFANHSIDLIFSNCCLPHIPEIRTALTEIQRVLSGNGVLLFTSYGYRTLEELGMSGHWPDMHDLGDLLLKLQFKDPVIDTEFLTINYAHLRDLLDDLQQSGAYQISSSDIPNIDQPINATYEIIYGYAAGKAVLSSPLVADKNTFFVQVTRGTVL